MLKSQTFHVAVIAISLFFSPSLLGIGMAQDRACDANELRIARDTIGKAKLALDKAVAAIDSSTDATSRKLIEWFGARTPADGATVRKTLVASRVFVDGATFRCAVNTDAKLGDVYATVTPTNSLLITLGHFFFSASDTGFSSRLGVLVHEMSHFIIAGATKDPKIYGASEARNLAKQNPVEALNNAENIEYFVESIYFGL